MTRKRSKRTRRKQPTTRLPAEPPKFRLITFGGSLPQVHYEPEYLKRMLEEEDIEHYRFRS